MLKKIIGNVILSSVLLCACGCSGNSEASEMSAAVTDNTAAQTTSATEQTTTAAKSTTTATSAVEELPESEEAAASDDAAVTEEVTVSEETPVSEESAITEEAPVSEEAPATEEVTASEETPATEEVTVSEEAAVTAEAPASEEAPETEEAAEPEPIVKILQGKPYIPDENATEDEQRMYGQYTEQREKYLQRYEKLAAQLDMPIVSIITLDKKAVLSKEEYVTSVVDVLNCDEEFAFSAAAGVRVRGNSTADGNEKPYRIKFDKKQNMLGLHEGNEYKSWVLLKSQWNLAMDYMGFTLADTILEDRYYSSDCTYVNVYINGAFKGIYLLCEQNQVGKDRVDIYEPTKDETGTDIGYLVEIDNYANEAEDPFFHVDYLGAELTDISGTTNTFVGADYSIKSDTYSDEQRAFIDRYINGAFRILYEAAENNTPMMFDENYDVVPADCVYSTAEEAARAVIDLDSLAFLLIHDELIHDYDVGEGSFYMAVDFSKDSTMQRLTFTAPWDFNWAYNEHPGRRFFACTFQPIVGEQDRSNPWYITAMKADWFSNIVRAKWVQLYNDGVLTEAVNEVRAGVEALRNDLGKEDWKIDSANDICKFVDMRILWLNKQWNNE